MHFQQSISAFHDIVSQSHYGLSAVHAGPVYALLGKKNLGTKEYPPPGTALVEGDIAFRQHEGGHTFGPNWPFFIEFA